MISEIVILYKPDQIDAILSRFNKESLLSQEKLRIIALDYEVEMALRKLSIPYQSLQEYLSPDSFSSLFKISARYIKEWYSSPEMDFFQHRSIKLAEAIKNHATNCVKEILYYLELFNILFNAYPKIQHLWIPHEVLSVFPAHSLNQFASQIPIKAGKLLGDSRGIVVSGVPYASHHRQQQTLVKIRKRLASPIRRALLHLINFAITVTRPPQKLKLLVVDKWSNIEPFISKMNNVELVMMQPEEIRKAKWQAWKKRIRFYYPNDFLTSDIKKTAKEWQSQFLSQWQTLGDNPKFSEGFHYNQISFWPVFKQFLDGVICHWAEGIVRQIECINRIFSRFSFDWVLLRGTSKPKFYITAYLAKQHGISSLELQHASVLELAKPFFDYFLPVDYLAAYGKITKELFLANSQNPPKNIIEIGSPRFDRYFLLQAAEDPQRQQLKNLSNYFNIKSSRPIVLIIAPPIVGQLEGWFLTSYDLITLFRKLTELQNEIQPKPQFIIKLRPHSSTREFYQKAVKEYLPQDTIIAQYEEDLASLLKLSDIIVSYESTAVLEAMIMKKPVVLFVINKEVSNFKLLRDAGALLLATDYDQIHNCIDSLLRGKEKREELVKNANTFLQNNYCFDGKSAERFIKLLNIKK